LKSRCNTPLLLKTLIIIHVYVVLGKRGVTLKSKGKQSQALKANESEDESPDEDSEDPSAVEKMAMLSY